MNSSIKKIIIIIKILIIWYNLYVLHHYVYTNETNIFKFWYNVFKKFNECLIRNQVSKY